ncbi:MAG: hypothetical protein ACYDEB_09665 [Dehalococcoidia bacterium]
MSRDQRRGDRKSQPRGKGAAISRKTPVRAGGRGVPWLPIGIAGSLVAAVALIAYLIVSSGSGASLSGPAKAAADTSSGIPGTFAPDQGRDHLPYAFSAASQRTPIPFCPGVVWSGAPNGQPASTPAGGGTPAADATPQPAQTPAAGTTAATTAPDVTPTVTTSCRDSNPPSSGPHYNVQNGVDLGGGLILPHIPPDPNVYPDDVVIPRDAIPHILEHAGVFLGWNCKSGDTACTDVVTQIKAVVNSRIDVNHDRVVMAHDPDLVEGTIGMSSWTRWEQFSYKDYKKATVVAFISKNSCRVDWEGFCP